MKQIRTAKIKDNDVSVPGSKSYTHRMLISAALSDGTCSIQNSLKSEDTLFTANALKRLGISIDEENESLIIQGGKGRLKACHEPIYLGNSGTSMRLLAGAVSLGEGMYTLTGSNRMHERPIQDLLNGLNQIGISASSINNNGCPPIEVPGGKVAGGPVSINCDKSSQYLSSLLLLAPCTEKGLEITVIGELVSKPYVDLTIDIMYQFGIDVMRDGYQKFYVKGKQVYQAGSFMVEPDCSHAGYFWAAAAITGAGVKVKGVTKNTRQGDLRFTEVLEKMGCEIIHDHDGIKVKGGFLSAIEADMADMPDMVPTLAVVAAFAKGKTVIKNVAHLKDKESDRLGSVATELLKMGIEAKAEDNRLIVTGGIPHGAEIDTYNDHRMAMSFSLAGLKIPGIIIKDENCVDKSFPNFWDVLENLYGS
ncbi:MAG: 3-phosphoshikimate 1-carboxyvinyltransferase [Desulfobacterales bacterium]|nr:3-phosphoshikimate 1-carboxyvinyltransferase [Desulfobacterales bacterium]